MSITTDSIGRVLGKRYRLVSALGSGASAHVYLAEDVSLQRLVAVKVLQPALAHDEAFLKRFRAEARSAASLNHPHVLRVFDWGEDADGPYLVLEYLGGGSLRDLLDRGVRLDHAQAARLGAQVAQGLAYAHARALVHRDVKPANLLFDEEERVSIADFGVARALAEAAWTEPEGAMVGTARYASPEQAEGRPVDGRADVYSLALVLYEAVTGTVPFVADTTVGTLMARVGAELPEDPALGPLQPVLAAAAAPEAADRLDAAGLARRLEELATTLPPPGPLGVEAPGTPAGPLELPGTGRGFQAPSVGDLTAVVPASETTAMGVRARATEPTELFDAEALEPAAALGPPAAADEVAGEGLSLDATAHATHRARPARTTEAGPAVPPPPTLARRRHRRRWPWVVAALVVVAAVAGAGAYAVRAKVFTPSRTVPVLRGLSLADARAAATAAHLTLRLGAPTYSTSVPAGTVVSQSPRAGTTLKQGAAVSVVASKGPPPVPVPSLTGLDCTTAQRLLAEAHLAGVCPQSLQQYSSSVPTGQVVSWAYSTTPQPAVAPWGGTVYISISEGPPPVPVPDVVSAGDTYPQAAAALQAVGLVASEATEPSTTVPAGQVIGTVPAVGTPAPVGSTVTVNVSTGPPMVAVPNLQDDTVAQAEAALSAAGLTTGQVYGPAKGTVFDTNPAQGTSVPEGSSVNLYTK